MQIEAHIMAWNEEETIHFTILHYRSLCDRVIIYDNYSTDKTPSIAQYMGCEVRQFGIKGELNDKEYKKLKDNCWKGSTSDWVIVCDADEILYHQDLKFILKQEAANGATIFKTQGFNVYSNEMPVSKWLDIKTGIFDNSYSKLCVFSPKLKEIDYIYGCHEAKPQGNIVWSKEKLWLLHYRCVGGVDRMIARHEQYKPRMAEINLRWKMGVHYLQLEEQKRTDFEDRLKRSVTFSEAGIISQ